MSNDWGFEDESDRVIVDGKEYERTLKRYISPCRKHDCEHYGCKGRYASPDTHEFQEVWDDFQLSQKKREDLFMEVVRSRGRQHREMTLMRMFVSTVDGTYWLRLAAPDNQQIRYGDLNFETQEECQAYYNYCVQLFGFSDNLRIRDTDDDEDVGFFADLDELEGGFFDDLDDIDGDSEDEDGWDTNDDEELGWE